MLCLSFASSKKSHKNLAARNVVEWQKTYKSKVVFVIYHLYKRFFPSLKVVELCISLSEWQQRIEKLYSDNLDRFGIDSRSVGWNSKESQELRFRKLMEIIQTNENNISIIEGSRNNNNKLSLNKSRLVDLLKKNSNQLTLIFAYSFIMTASSSHMLMIVYFFTVVAYAFSLSAWMLHSFFNSRSFVRPGYILKHFFLIALTHVPSTG